MKNLVNSPAWQEQMNKYAEICLKKAWSLVLSRKIDTICTGASFHKSGKREGILEKQGESANYVKVCNIQICKKCTKLTGEIS